MLAYAAFLRGHSIESLEGALYRSTSSKRVTTPSSMPYMLKTKKEQWIPLHFKTQCRSLNKGNFHLVLVLDEISAELERVVAYLDALTLRALTIDLITLNVYEVNGAQIALPQRVSPFIDAAVPSINATSSVPRGPKSDGSDAFRASVDEATGDARTTFEDLIAWAEALATLPNVRLSSYAGRNSDRFTQLPRIMPDNAGLVTIWNDKLQPSISVWRSVFERRAPQSIGSVERLIAPNRIGQGNVVSHITTEVLNALSAAYQEATGAR